MDEVDFLGDVRPQRNVLPCSMDSVCVADLLCVPTTAEHWSSPKCFMESRSRHRPLAIVPPPCHTIGAASALASDAVASTLYVFNTHKHGSP